MTDSRLTAGDLLVTTERSPSEEVWSDARALAERLDAPLVSRRKESLERLTGSHARRAALVVASDGIRLVRDGRRYGFHPSMARHRVAALEHGRADRLVTAAGLTPGDSFLDCTCGLGADAITAAHAVGATGRVETIEASPVLAAIVARGLARYADGSSSLRRAMRRVRVISGNHAALLRSYPASSRDVVYFDPMFQTTIAGSCGLALVRMLAVSGTPSRQDIAEARRVARRSVIVKDRAPGALLDALRIGVVSDTGRVWYGRLDV